MIRAAMLLATLAGPAGAQAMLREADQTRLDTLTASAGAGLLRAMANGARGDVDRLQEALAGAPIAPIRTTLAGEWQCRMIKTGEVPPLVVYAPFLCRITADGADFRFEKLTGSQRIAGRIGLRDEGMVLTGAGYVEGTGPIDYSDFAEDFETDGTLWPIVGIVEQVSDTRARILMPWPLVDSAFDVLELTR